MTHNAAAPSAPNETTQLARGMGLAVIGALILPGMDSLAKLVGESGAMSPGQITFMRFAVQTAVSFAILVIAGGLAALRPRHFPMNFLRGVLLGAASLCFFLAVKYMPLADAIAVFFVEPLILTLLSWVVLKERFGWRRWAAILAGFGGAVLVIQPSYAIFGPVSLLPLMTALLFAIYLLLNRIAGRSDGAMVMQYVAGLGGMAVCALALAAGEIGSIGDLGVSFPRDTTVWLLVLAMGLIGVAGHYLFVRAFQMVPASVLAPFQYLEIVSAAALGLLMFGDFPTPSKWLGIAIIVASGLVVFWRERSAD